MDRRFPERQRSVTAFDQSADAREEFDQKVFRVFRDYDRGRVLIDVIKGPKAASDGIFVILLQLDHLHFVGPSVLPDTTTDAHPSDMVNQELEDVCRVL